MLVLTRKMGECIRIGDGVTLTVIEISGQKIRLGVEAPKAVRILRSELMDADRMSVKPPTPPVH